MIKRSLLAFALLGLMISPALAQFAPVTFFGGCAPVSAMTAAYAAFLGGGFSQRDLCALDVIAKAISANSITNLDALYIFANRGPVPAKTNFVNPGVYTLTPTSSPILISYRGQQGNAAGYYDTGFNPTTAVTPHFTQNSASMGIFGLTDVVSTTFDVGNTRSELRLKSSGNNATSQFNASAANSTVIPSAQGDLVVSRSSSAGYKQYFNGIDLNCTACASQASATLTNSNFWIGASDNASGLFTTKIVFAAYFGGALTSSQVAALSTALHTYAAIMGITLPWPGDTIFVSNTSANGIPVGNDTTGVGTRSAPYLTPDKALSVQSSGQPILINNGTYSPASTFYSITQSVNISAVVPGTVTLQRLSGQSRIFNIALPAGGNFTLGGQIILDGQNDAANIAVLNNASGAYTVTFGQGVEFLNFTQYGAATGSGNLLANVVDNGVNCQFVGARACFNLASWTAGSFVGKNATVSGATTAAGFGAYLDADANAVGPTVSVTNPTATIAAFENPASFTVGVHVLNVPNVSVAGGTLGFSSNVGNCKGVQVSADLTVPLDSSGAIVDGVTVNHDCGGGGTGIIIGEDGTGPANNEVNNGTVRHNKINGTARSQAASLHAIEIGYQTGAQVYGNQSDTTQYLTVIKGMQGTPLVYSNIGTNLSTKCLYQKGGTGAAFWNNVCFFSTGVGTIGLAVDDDGLNWDTSGTIAFNNAFYFSGGAGQFVSIDPNYGISSFGTNDYWATGSLPSNAFAFGLTNYGSVAAWAAAHEATALGVDPVFVNPGIDFHLQGASTLKAAGTHNSSVVNDFDGFTFANPPSVGAYQFH